MNTHFVIICFLLKSIVLNIEGGDVVDFPNGMELPREHVCRSGYDREKFECMSSSCICLCHGIEKFVNCSYLNLTQIPNDIPADTAKLDLSHNNIFEITSTAFDGLLNLSNLDLSFNNINSSSEGCLSYLVSLKILNISMNGDLRFTNFRNITHGLNNTSIEELRASYIQDPDIYPSVMLQSQDLMGIYSTKMKILHLDGNQIQRPRGKVANYLPKSLETLSVRRNVLGNYKIKEVFEFAVHHPNLTTIDISYQCDYSRLDKVKNYKKFNTDEDGMYPSNRRRRRYITEINPDSSIKGTRLDECKEFPFVTNSALKKIIARDASFTKCIGKIGFGKIDLQYLDLSRNNLRSLVGPVTASPPHNISYVDLSDNACRNLNDTFFNNITSIETLLLAGNFLGPSVSRTVSPFRPLANLTKLDLSRNQLTDIYAKLLDNHPKLSHLNLSMNMLKIFNISMDRLVTLKYIDLSYNQISNLKTSEMKWLDRNARMLQENVTLDLSNNPLHCTCKEVDFWKWMRNTKVIVKIANLEKCRLDNGTLADLISFRDERVIADLEKMCRSPFVLYIAIPFACLLIIFISGAMLYKKRWEITYKWYIYRLRRKGYTPVQGSMGCDFDAFVSYSDKDADFVHHVLLTKLEEEYGCHLCLHQRNFRPGERIASNIISAIHNSSKTLVILSRAYLKSKWCRYELHMATEEEHHVERKVVVIVVLEEIPKKDLPVEVLEHFSKNTYIRKPKKAKDMETFWDAVREAVSRN